MSGQPTTYRPLSFAHNLVAAGRRDPGKIALIAGDRSLSFRDLADRLKRVAAAGQTDLHLTAGARAIILAPNCLEYIEIVLGLASIGVAVVTLSHRSTALEVQDIAEDCGATVVFVHETCLAAAAGLTLRKIIIGADYDPWLAKASPGELPSVDETLPFVIPYTSGSTGRPKGVLLSQRTRMLVCYASAGEYGCFSPDDRYLAVSPLSHGGGFAYALASLVFGGTCDIMMEYEPELLVARLAAGDITGVFLVPTHFHQMLSIEKTLLETHRGKHRLKTIISNAAPLSDELRYQVLDYWGEGILHETYGSTEGGIVSNLRPADQRRKKRCVGLPFPNTEIRIVGDDGVELGPGDIGELRSRSPYHFNGYLNRDEETSAVLRDGGWIAVGDLAYRDDEGYLHIAGRKKDMIISGGFNIYPREIEEILLTHPAVIEAAVIGIDDDKWGEVPVAAIVLHAGTSTASDALKHFCRERLAGYKVPKHVVFLESFPKAAIGKVQKAAIKTLVTQMIANDEGNTL